MLYMEGVRDGRRLGGSLRAAARVKPVVLMKVGRYPAGSRAAVSHTGAIVGRDDVFDAVVRRTGAVIGAAGDAPKPVIACWMGEASVASGRAMLRLAGFSAFRLPEMAVEAFAYLAQFYRNQRTLLQVPPPLVQAELPDLQRARAIVAKALAEGRAVLAATESKELLDAFRIPVARAVDAASAHEAVAAAERIGYPVVMKIHSPDITHKSDVGGVRLALPNAAAIREAYGEMMAAAARLKPGARVSGVSIEPMVTRPHARELMAGIVRDPVFGPAIVFGAGGIATEGLKDRAVGLPPLNAAQVEDMIRGTRIAKMLAQFRHLPPVDHAALDAVLLRVSEMAVEPAEIDELDINPRIADESGVLALDARVVVRKVSPGLPRYGHLAIAAYPAELTNACTLADGSRVVLRPIRP